MGFKTNRPDPIKLMETMEVLGKESDAAEINANQIAAENAEFNERYRVMLKLWQEEVQERTRRHHEALEQQAKARRNLMEAWFPVMRALIEDMKS